MSGVRANRPSRRSRGRLSGAGPSPVPVGREHAQADLGRLARGGTLNLAGSAAGALLGLLLVVVVARALHSGGTGVFFESVALFSILANTAELGADTGAVRQVARHRALGRIADVRGTLMAGLGPVLVIATVLGALVYAFAPQLVRVFINGVHQSQAITYLHVLAFFIPPAAGSIVALSATRGLGTMIPYVALENVGKPLLRPILTMLAVAFGMGATAIGVAWALPVAVEFPAALLVLAVLLRREERRQAETGPARPLRQLAAEFWRFSTPRGLAAVFQITVLWLDVLLVGALRSTTEAGVYAAVSRFAVFGIMGLEAIRVAIAPQLSGLLARGETERAEHLYQVATSWVIAAAWPVYLTMAVFAPLPLRLFGVGFQSGQGPLLVLSLAMLVNLSTGNVTVVLLMGGKSWWNLVNTLGSLTVNIVLNLILIPRIGITGAALAWAASIGFENLAPLVQVARFLHLRPFGAGYWRAVAITLMCFGVVGLAARLALGATLPALGLFAVCGLTLYVFLMRASRDRLELPMLWRSFRGARARTAEVAAEGRDG